MDEYDYWNWDPPKGYRWNPPVDLLASGRPFVADPLLGIDPLGDYDYSESNTPKPAPTPFPGHHVYKTIMDSDMVGKVNVAIALSAAGVYKIDGYTCDLYKFTKKLLMVPPRLFKRILTAYFMIMKEWIQRSVDAKVEHFRQVSATILAILNTNWIDVMMHKSGKSTRGKKLAL
jgi:hypothetical protein